MSLDLHKYEHIVFHEDEAINNKIKVYMLVFDYRTMINKLTDEQKLELLMLWNESFIEEEFYEIIPVIGYRVEKLKGKIKYDKLSAISKMAHKLSDILTCLVNNKKNK